MADQTNPAPVVEPVGARLDNEALSRWMDRQSLPGTGELAQVRELSGGSQNELHEIARGGVRMALRHPPATASRDSLLEHYAKISGRDVSAIDYYVVLARFKFAIVLEASVARHAKGKADDRVSRFGPIVLELMRKAASLARTHR
ncbi:hypothetical protein ACFY3G_49965 [Streptomyces phaeochromogenes]|uniref:hypothetical protein n=1 Tax=Streptomyces phaeochromogenes TaxID=1923 RepID=UPI00368F64FC